MTLSTGSGMEVVSTSDIVAITHDIWTSFLDLELEPGDDGSPVAHDVLTGVVEVTDAWHGWVVLECAPETARAMAAAMFLVAPELVCDGDVTDALGELTNMIGGNVKSLLPAPSRLSLPAVHHGSWRPDGAALVQRVDFVAGAGREPVRISVWEH